jgi:outer membrane protein assembly factor BamB
MLPEVSVVLSQSETEVLSALDPTSGSTLWTLPRRLPPDPPFGRRFPSPLSCAPELTPDGKLVLRFSEGLYAVNPKTGQPLWMQKLFPPTQCAAVTPDSGVVVISGRRKGVTKFDGGGNVAWKADLPLDGAAVNAPEVVPTSGDVLVRMARHLVCFDPGGRLKWTRPLGGVPAVSPAADVIDE